MTLDHEADQAIGLIRRLVLENERLSRQVVSLEQQLEASRAAGGDLGPDTAKAWVEAMAAARPEIWKKQVIVGDDHWDSFKGVPTGIGLRALLLHLMAIPQDDQMARINWDTHWRRHRPERVGQYPPRFRPSTYSPATWLRKQGRDGLAETLEGLLKGIRPSTKAYCLITAAFLLLIDDGPVAHLSNDPGTVLDWILNAQREATAPAQAEGWRRFEDLFQRQVEGPSKEAAAATLEVAQDASPEEIRSAYRAKAREHHPDAGGDAEQFHRISEAYSLLTA